MAGVDTYKPVYPFVRRQGHPPHQAQDLTQEFFSRFLGKDYLDSVDREKGRFRSFVLACLKHFLSTARVRAASLKRGGHQRFISLEECNLEEQFQATGEPDASAERTFDRKWATTVMEQALRLLRQEFTAGGKASQFESLKKFLSADPAPGNALTNAAADDPLRKKWRKGTLMRPFCQMTLIRSRSATYGDLPHTNDLGKRLRERRAELGANQRICALRLGVCHKTLKNWEANRVEPAKKYVGRILEFICRHA